MNLDVYNELRSIMNLNTKQVVMDMMKLILAEETLAELKEEETSKIAQLQKSIIRLSKEDRELLLKKVDEHL